MNKIICLWSCPRNISTALMYSFAQRKDTLVFDEPLYAHYLKVSGVNHPVRQEVLSSLETNGNKVVREIILQNNEKILFHKLMSHFLIDINTDFLSLVENIIFIRNPKEIINSYSKVITDPTIDDIGIKKQYELYLDLKSRNINPIILDSKYLLQNPKKILSKICVLLDIPFDTKMLKWKKGARSEDGVWGKYWYKNLHNSSEFLKWHPKDTILTQAHERIANECFPYYDFLTAKSIQL